MTDTIIVSSETKKRGRPPKIQDEKIEYVPISQEKSVEKQDKPVDKDYNIEIIRDFDGIVDPFYLSKKDPNYEYRFLRDEHKNLSIKTGNLLFQKGGWQICQKEHLFKIGIKPSEISPDGLLRRGDTILAFMPKKLFLEKEKYKIEKANEPMKAVKRRLSQGDSSVGGIDIHGTMRGIETAKQLGMK